MSRKSRNTASRRRSWSDFGYLPHVVNKRHRFDLSHRVLTSIKPGFLTPVDIVEVLPGDTWHQKVPTLTRLTSTFVRPLMDDIYLDTYSFFCPLRLAMEDVDQVFANSSPSAYQSQDLLEIPTFSITEGNLSGTVADYLGLPVTNPTSSGGTNYSVLPFREFALIWNEFFRDQNVSDEVFVYTSSSTGSTEDLNTDPWSSTNYTGGLPPVVRYKDYFSSALPGVQKGPAVNIPGLNGIPVTTGPSNNTGSTLGLRWLTSSGTLYNGTVDLGTSSGQTVGGSSFSASTGALNPANLFTNTTVATNFGGTIESLRTAMQLQKYLERDAFYGSRYREYLYASYGVVSPDARMQVPEFLCGSHSRLQVQQVTSSASSSEGNNQEVGSLAAMSQTFSTVNTFNKMFTEHGYIITVACIRYKHLYSQALNPLWTRIDRDDFFDPLFANLGPQAIDIESVYGSDLSNPNLSVLGYTPIYSSYRTVFDRVTGQMRPSPGSLGQYWSMADSFSSTPSLLDLKLEPQFGSGNSAFERVLTGSTSVDPFVVDFNFQQLVDRVVPAWAKSF